MRYLEEADREKGSKRVVVNVNRKKKEEEQEERKWRRKQAEKERIRKRFKTRRNIRHTKI